MQPTIISTPTTFSMFTLQGDDAKSFLQGQVTCNMNKLADINQYQATAISNLKGRIEFGIWLKQCTENQFNIVISQDCAVSFASHVKKFGAFSKMTLSNPQTIFPYVNSLQDLDNKTEELNNKPSFNIDEDVKDVTAWERNSLATGNYWITSETQGLFQPQELRLHQRGGVDYDKGCYLGQEVIARVYFKSSPKAFLHRISGIGETPKAGDTIGQHGKVKVVNAVSTSDTDGKHQFEALVVARPEQLLEINDLTVLTLPAPLMESVARV